MTFSKKHNIIIAVILINGGSILAIGDVIVGIDIGTSKVSSVIAEINNFNQLEIIAIAECKCFGMKKTKITDEDEIASAIGKTISEVEAQGNIKINSAYVTIPGKYVQIVQNSIVKEARDKFAGITSKDINSAMLQLRDIDLPDDKVVIDLIKNQFILDNGRTVEDPVGALSSTVTVTGQVILADKDYVRQLTSIFKKAFKRRKIQLSDPVIEQICQTLFYGPHFISLKVKCQKPTL